MQDLEKEMKKHFKNRKIQPSKSAWDKMEALLEEQQPKQKKPKTLFYFLSVAASIALLVGLWTILKESDSFTPEAKSTEIFVVNDKQEMVKPKQTEKQEVIKEEKEIIVHHRVKKNESKRTSQPKLVTEEYIVSNSDVSKKEIVLIPEKEEMIPVHKIKEEPLIAARSNVEIKVDPERLLQRAEIERQVENMVSEKQNFWKKVGEKHQFVQSH